MEERTMSKKVEPINYPEEKLLLLPENLARACHNELKREEKRYGKVLYDKFGVWKRQHPEHPLANRNFPNGEYVQVISAFWNYFDKKYPDNTNTIKLDV